MARPVGPLAELGRSIAETQDWQIAQIELSTQERLLSDGITGPGRRRRRWAALSLAAAAVVVRANGEIYPLEGAGTFAGIIDNPRYELRKAFPIPANTA